MTTPLYYIRLNYKSAKAYANLKSSNNKRQKSIVFVGFIICYILVLESFIVMSFLISIMNIDHCILFAAEIRILLLILHCLNYKPARVPPF